MMAARLWGLHVIEPSSPPHVLVVDDEESLREELGTFLAWHGMVVSRAGSGAEALNALGEDPAITVVLSDIRMAGLDGIGLAQSILSARGEAEAVEVVLMTGHGSIDTATKALRVGVFDFLRKPMQLTDTVATLRRAHDKSVRRREAEARRVAELERLRADYAALQQRLAEATQPLRLASATPPELAHVLSHELRTPLIPLLALPDMLETGEPLPPGVLTTYLDDVRQAGARLLDIATDLVEFLAPPSPNGFQWRVIPAASVIDGLIQRMQPSAAAAGVAIETGTIDAGDVETAFPQLTSALSRLVANAITATPAGGHIELSVETAAEGRLGFAVRDFGKGMTAADTVLARQPFRQLDMSLTRRSGGMGLGLPLADRMAVALGGALDLVSAPGCGTVARIVVPRRREATVA